MNFTIDDIKYYLDRENIPQAEVICRILLEQNNNNSLVLFYLGVIAEKINSTYHAKRYYKLALAKNIDNNLARERLNNLNKKNILQYKNNCSGEKKEKYLLIKAWGCGFWADINHVVSQLLLAELTQRIPVIHWGQNSLFFNNDEANIFASFFEKVSEYTINDLMSNEYTYFPDKWNHDNLKQEEINKFTGDGSRMAAILYFNRTEDVAVSDFYSGIVDIKPWIHESHPLYEYSVENLYRSIITRYIKPKKNIIDAVDEFCDLYLPSKKYIAVHARGSDKICEISNIDKINEKMFECIDSIETQNQLPIFLMTDDKKILLNFISKYGNRIIKTECQRTDSNIGIHYSAVRDRTLLGTEIMIDSYIAARASYFIGNGFSNASAMIPYLMPAGRYATLIGPNVHHDLNYVLHSR